MVLTRVPPIRVGGLKLGAFMDRLTILWLVVLSLACWVPSEVNILLLNWLSCPENRTAKFLLPYGYVVRCVPA